MKIFLSISLLCLVAFVSQSQTVLPTPEVQIKTAVMAAPADKRDSATVYGYSPSKEVIVLRKGTNELICLTDDPGQPGFSASCYHKDLEPFMKRGRELKKQGKSVDEVFKTRETETKSGKLVMPKQPATLFVLSAPKENYDSSSGEVKNGYLRYVIYTPYATAKSTDLPLKPELPAMPWLMHPGTHGAHIMINPPRN